MNQMVKRASMVPTFMRMKRVKNDVAYTQQSEEQGRNNLAASGQAVLPKTGESEKSAVFLDRS